jgi:hypothetical protein
MNMRYYDELATYERDGFTVIVDKSYEDLSLSDCFDDSLDENGVPLFDLKEMARDIDSGNLDWFMLRIRVMVDSLEMGSHYLGGCLYKDAREVLTDGTAEDCIGEALAEAKREVYKYKQKFAELSDMVDREGIVSV